MNMPFQAIPVPLRADGRGGFRVGATRVPLEVVLDEYENGASPEAIVSAYPTLDLADVHAVLSYYLRHREEVEVYLQRRRAEAEEWQRKAEERHPGRDALRAKLLARRREQEQDRASPGG